MERLEMKTPNIANENFRKLAEMFPNAVTEAYDDNGRLVRAIDKDVLMQEISCEVVDGKTQRYRFQWPDKNKAILTANTQTQATLRPCREESVDFDNTQNLYIEGDNLEVLKVLRNSYKHKIKMIYIDPPYNTGSDFVYEDDFSSSTKEHLISSGQIDEEGNRLRVNLESNGRFHTDWLNMIYPRLKISRDLLADDGVIFLSIDDKEIDNLKKICNELFGERNFVSDMIWQSRTSISNDDEVSTNHNHTLIYSKNRDLLRFGGDLIDPNDYINPDNDPRGAWKLVPIDANHTGGATVYPITNPKTNVQYYPPNGRVWCYNEQTLNELMADGRIKFGISDDSAPKRKLYYNERIAKGDKKTPSSILLDAGTTKDGTKTIMSLFDGKKVFDYPKSVELLEKLIRYGSFDGKGIILDFFSGSATTAHAIMKMNAEYNGSRKFIMVQLPEDLDISLKHSKTKETVNNAISLCDELKVPHTICEIGKERIRRAGKKIKEETGKDIDYGFKVLRLSDSNMKKVFYTPEETQQTFFDDLTENIKEDRTSEDLLFQVMLELGLELSYPISKTEICGKEVFNINIGDEEYLYACFDKGITEEVVKSIAERRPYYAVFRDSGMQSDDTFENFEQIFKKISPETIRKVL